MRAIAVAGVLWSLAAQSPAPSVPDGDAWLTKPVDDRTFATYLDFFQYTKSLPFETIVGSADTVEGLPQERLSFQSTPGARVTAVLFQPPGAPQTNAPAMILLHAGGGRGKDAPGTIRFAQLLSRAGWLVLAIDMPYFGERATGLMTTFSEQEKHEKLYNQPSVYLAWVTQTVKDIGRAYDFLVGERRADPRRVGLIGFSRGAIMASIAGGADRRLAPVAVIYGGHFDALENGHLPAACPANYIGRIAPRGLLMVNGVQDSDMIKARAVDPWFKLARQPKQIIWAEGGHGFMTDDHRAAIVQWLRERHQ